MKKTILNQIVLVGALVATQGASAQRSIVSLPKASEEECAKNIAQPSKLALPHVSFAGVPLYPPLARISNVEGVVHVEVTTDGHKVTIATAEKDSHSLLARAAEANALTWQFAVHEPTTFIVTYRYKLVDDIDPVQNNPRVILRLPTDVEVDTLRWPGIYDPPAELSLR